MKDFRELLSTDLYNVEKDDDGKNWIHVLGYFYPVDREYRLVEYTWLFLDPDEFRKFGFDYYEKMQEQSKQYIGDCSNDEIEGAIEEYFEGAKNLPMKFVFNDTPEGLYYGCPMAIICSN